MWSDISLFFSALFIQKTNKVLIIFLDTELQVKIFFFYKLIKQNIIVKENSIIVTLASVYTFSKKKKKFMPPQWFIHYEY